MIKMWIDRISTPPIEVPELFDAMQAEIDELRAALKAAESGPLSDEAFDIVTSENIALKAKLAALETTGVTHNGKSAEHWNKLAVMRWQENQVLEGKLDALAADAEKSVKLLAMLFDRFENGVQCYEDPEDYTGFLGHSVNLTDDEFRECAEILNRLAPIAMKEANHD